MKNRDVGRFLFIKNEKSDYNNCIGRVIEVKGTILQIYLLDEKEVIAETYNHISFISGGL
jgi:hypothetical protein